MGDVKGFCDAKFQELRDLLQENVATGKECGACICVNINGRNVVDLWAGYTDPDRTQPWQENTIVNMFSVSKTITSLAALMLADRGLLNVDDKVANHWPEFAQNGKQDIEIRHILSHSSGVSGWEKPISLEDICSVEKSTALLAKQSPWWNPGTASGYHAFNQGHLVGEVIRRVTGKNLKRFIAEEIAEPLGADFQLGAIEQDWPRIATLLPPGTFDEMEVFPADSVAAKTRSGPTPKALFALTAEWRRAEIGAANGHGNARGVCKILSAVSLGGEVDGTTLLSPKTIDLIFREQTRGHDLVLAKPLRFGIGFGLPLPETVPWIPGGRKCFWTGWVSTAPLTNTFCEANVTFDRAAHVLS